MNEMRMVVHAGWQLSVTVIQRKSATGPATFLILQQAIRHPSAVSTQLPLSSIESASYATADGAFEASFRFLRKHVDRLLSRDTGRHAL
jgi:hypothetical protein